jgi:hypothetical protein
LNEQERNQVLWVRAVEEADADGQLLSAPSRDRASRRARPLAPPQTAEPEAFLTARAAILSGELAEAEPGVEQARDATRMPPTWSFLALGLVAGLLLEALSSERRINLLALPLLGVLAWNAALFALELVRMGKGGPARLPIGMRGFLARVPVRRTTWLTRGQTTLWASVLTRFGSLWLSDGAEAAAHRLRARLHVSALGFAGGIIAGMYTAGFALAYRATWESTFLVAEAAHRFLAVLLAPGVALLQLPLPGVAELANLEAPASGEAADWIHRWAVSVAVWIGLPRLVFAGIQAAAARRSATRAGLDLDDPYYRRLFAWREAGGRGATVLPYSTKLAAGATASLQELLFELLGNRTQIQLADAIRYGEAMPSPVGQSPDDVIVLVFNLAQSPEQEVHGRAIEEIQAQRSESGRLLVLLDEEAYAQKTDETRLLERRRSWQRVAREAGVVAVPFAGSDHPMSEAIDAASRELGVSAEPAR